jgi:hypothetical protein
LPDYQHVAADAIVEPEEVRARPVPGEAERAAGRPRVAETPGGLAQQEHEAYAQPDLASLVAPVVTLLPVPGCDNLNVYIEGHRIGTLARMPGGWSPIGACCWDRNAAGKVYPGKDQAAALLVKRWRELTWRMYGAMRDLEGEYVSCERIAGRLEVRRSS